VRAAMLASTASLYLASSALAFDPAREPAGVGYALSVTAPDVKYPLPFIDNYRNQTGTNAAGQKVNNYDGKDNPVIDILSGFNAIWTLGDDSWAHGGANGDGASSFDKVRIVDPLIWRENMDYVLSVTGSNRTPAAALAAYLDDRRSQGYSVIDGLGPLADWYRQGAGATTTIDHTLGNFAVNEVSTTKEDDKGTDAGSDTSELKDVVTFMTAMRGPEGTTSPAKYFFASPRPWRMSDSGEVIQTGTETLGDKQFEAYQSNVQVVPALKYVRETRGRQKDGGFPSGHTNAAYLAAIAYAYAVPERFSELLTRASELGENRVVAGMHSPLDVIGGRIMATATAAAYLNDPRLASSKKAAYDAMHAYFGKQLQNGQSLYSFAQSGGEADRFTDKDANRAAYRQRMSYGFTRNMAAADIAMTVPKGAEVLLETRLPYLDAAQRRAVLHSTGIGSGYPLLDDSNGWGRINLVAAADGFGAFDGDVPLHMDASAGGFNAADRWSNDITGPGRLLKTGTGTLTLLGQNSYRGGTVLEEGGLIAGASTAFGNGPLFISGGQLDTGAEKVLDIGSDFTQTGGALSVTLSSSAKALIAVAGTARISGGTLHVRFEGTAPKSGDHFPLMSADRFDGGFAEIKAEGISLKPVATQSGLVLVVE
jgi:autotransporter-associated beta strand protein